MAVFAKEFRSPINLLGNELLNFAIEKVVADPTDLYTARAWFNTTENKIKYFDGTVVQVLVDVTTLLATTLDKFAKTVANLDINGNKLVNVVAGSDATDAINKGQLDTLETALNDAIENLSNAVSNGLQYIGSFDASAGSYAAITSGSQGDFYKVSVDGTIEGVEWRVGDMLIINTDSVGTPVASAIDKIDNTEAADLIRQGTMDGVTVEYDAVSGKVRVKALGITKDLINSNVAGNGLEKAVGGELVVKAADDTIEVAAGGIKVTAQADFRNHKATALIGDATLSTFVIAHTLGSEDVVIQVSEVATKAIVDVYADVVDATHVRVVFTGYTPTVGEFKVLIIG